VVSFAFLPQPICSGTDQSATGSTSCGLGPDSALGQVSPSLKVGVAAQFGVFAPTSPNSSAVATASASLPVDIEGGTGQGFVEIEIDDVSSNPVFGSSRVSVAGGTLFSGTFLDDYNAVTQYQYGTPFTLSFDAFAVANTGSPYSAMSLEVEKYRLLENFPCSDPGCIDVPIPFATAEISSFVLSGAGLIVLIVSYASRRHRPTNIAIP
jgi:hypothetical protein